MSVARGNGAGTGTAWAIGTGGGSPVNSSAGTIDPGHTNTYLVCAVVHDAGQTVTSVVLDAVGTNQAFSFLGSVSNPGGGQVGELWGLSSPTAVAAKVLTATFSGTPTAANVSGAYYTGVLGSVVFSSTSGTSTGPSLSIPTASGDATFSVVFDNKTQNVSNPATGAQTTISLSNVTIDTAIGDALSTGASDNHVWAYAVSIPWGEAGLWIKASAVAADTLWAASCL